MIQLEFVILKKERKFRTRMSLIFITSYSSHHIHHIIFITSNSSHQIHHIKFITSNSSHPTHPHQILKHY